MSEIISLTMDRKRTQADQSVFNKNIGMAFEEPEGKNRIGESES